MKILMLVLFMLMIGCSPVEPRETLSYQQSIELSQNNNKNIVLFFTGQGCVPCQKWKKEVMNDPSVNKALRNYLFCIIDCEDNEDIANKYKIEVLPQFIIIDRNEIVLSKKIGYTKAQDFIKWLGEH